MGRAAVGQARQLDVTISRRRALLTGGTTMSISSGGRMARRAHAAVVAVVAADQRAVAALEHPDDAPFGATLLMR
jgi:hypothetical protein